MVKIINQNPLIWLTQFIQLRIVLISNAIANGEAKSLHTTILTHNH